MQKLLDQWVPTGYVVSIITWLTLTEFMCHKWTWILP